MRATARVYRHKAETEVPPADIETERSIISAALIDNSTIGEVLEIIKPADFYTSVHGLIFSAIVDLYSRGEPVDLNTLRARLNDVGNLQTTGGAEYLVQIVESAPLAVNARHYARIVRRAADGRRVLEALNTGARKIYDGGDPAEVSGALRSKLDEITTAPSGPEAGFWFVPAAEMQPRPVDWLVRDFIELNTNVLIFGDSDSGKSFATIDLCCCCATGRPWHGHAVKRTGPAAYICGEGRSGIGRRIKANCIRHHQDMNTLQFYVSTLPAGLCDGAQLSAVRAAVDAIARQHGAPVLIVVDTLARNFGPGDENSTQDMSAFVAAIDQLRLAYGAAVVVVHHTGHQNKDRSRGAAALRAAVDAEYRIDRDPSGLIRMTCTKMKDAPAPTGMAFQPRVVELGITDDDGKPVTSLVLDDADWTPPAKTGHEGKGKWQRLALETLQALHEQAQDNLVVGGYSPSGARVTFDDWRTTCLEKGMPHRSAFWKAKESLQKLCLVVVKDGFAELA